MRLELYGCPWSKHICLTKLSLMNNETIDGYLVNVFLDSREDEGRQRIPHTWAYSDENYLVLVLCQFAWLFFGRHLIWSVDMTTCSLRFDF